MWLAALGIKNLAQRIVLQLHFSNSFGIKRNSVWCLIYWKSIILITVQIWLELPRFRKWRFSKLTGVLQTHPLPPQKWPNWIFDPKRRAMFWNLSRNNFQVFAIFILWEMVDFVHKVLRKLTKMSPKIVIQWCSNFSSRLDQNAFQKILREWKKSLKYLLSQLVLGDHWFGFLNQVHKNL